VTFVSRMWTWIPEKKYRSYLFDPGPLLISFVEKDEVVEIFYKIKIK